MPRLTALITGATAGLGAAFAHRLAAESYDLVLVARDEARLHAQAAELTDRYGVAVQVLVADLATDVGTAAVVQRLTAGAVNPTHRGAAAPGLTATDAAEAQATAVTQSACVTPETDATGGAGTASRAPIDLLVNNAGFTLNRSFLESDPADEERLLRVNVHAVMRLTRAALPGMVRRRHGGIVNVASVAGFAAVMPGSTYSATKAWVINFSESMAHSVRRHGVQVLALCPGYVRTEFHQRAGIDMSRTPPSLWLTADAVVADAVRALRRGRVIRVVDWRYRMLVTGMRLAPTRLVHAIARGARGRLGREPR